MVKVCKKHLKLLEKGTTYQLVEEDECNVCQNIPLLRDFSPSEGELIRIASIIKEANELGL